VANLFFALGLHTLGTVLEPSVELRHWRQHVFDTPGIGMTAVERTQSSRLATISLRATARVADVDLFPSAGYTLLGRLASVDDAGLPVSARLTGFHVGLVVQAAP
jgi:hypothetical protein